MNLPITCCRDNLFATLHLPIFFTSFDIRNLKRVENFFKLCRKASNVIYVYFSQPFKKKFSIKGQNRTAHL